MAPSPDHERAWVTRMVRWAITSHPHGRATSVLYEQPHFVSTADQAILRLALVQSLATLPCWQQRLLVEELTAPDPARRADWRGCCRNWRQALQAQGVRPSVAHAA